MTFWSAHTHSRFSTKDALPSVPKLVGRAADLGYPAIGLTDHGNMAGSVQLYQAARKHGIEPLPGVELYMSVDRGRKARKFIHMCLLSTTADGYRNLVSLVTQSHEQFYFRPTLDYADLAQASADGRLDGVVGLSGCWFGTLPKLLREGHSQSASNMLTALAGWFKDGFYVELQHHNVNHAEQDDATHVAQLHTLATQLGLPVIIGQDSHYCYLEDRAAHDTMKKLGSWDDEDPDSAVFPGDGYHMVDDTWLIPKYTETQFADGMAGLDDLLGKAKVVIPELDTFKLAVPDTGGNPDAQLSEMGYNALYDKFDSKQIPKSRHAEYTARMEEELEIIMRSGFSGYLLLTRAVCQQMRAMEIGFFVRGSASGSLLCWLIGITGFDSISWGLPFDRFLSTDRTKPPDIDIDIEHERRDEVITWLGSQWHISRIGSWGTLKINRDGGDPGGSLVIQHEKYRRRMRDQCMLCQHGSGHPCSAEHDPDRQLNVLESEQLYALAEHKASPAYGLHAAGVLITPDEYTAGCVPLMYVSSSQTMATQFYKDDVEALGLVKLDLIGSKTATAVRIASDLAGVAPAQIPQNDKKTFAALRAGKVTGVFQLEGGTNARVTKQVKPRTIKDIIDIVTLGRPAVLDSGATDAYVSRRHGKTPTPPRHQIIVEETKDTYGVILYQEQALSVMKRLGLTVEEMEKARKAIKASNEYIGDARQVMKNLRAKISEQAVQVGMTTSDIEWLNDALDAYSGYGFNKAHSTSYGVIAYITAYLRTNHPVAFWAGTLAAYESSTSEVWYGPPGQKVRIKQIVAYKKEAVVDGVKVLPPHVNRSAIGFKAEPDLSAIRTGLLSIDQVGEKAAAELAANAPYTDLTDLATRVSARIVSGSKALGQGHSLPACGGVITALANAGALDGLAPVPPPPPKRTRRKPQEEVLL